MNKFWRGTVHSRFQITCIELPFLMARSPQAHSTGHSAPRNFVGGMLEFGDFYNEIGNPGFFGPSFAAA